MSSHHLRVPTGLFILLAAYQIGSKLFRRWAISHFTVLPDLLSVGMPRKDGEKFPKTVIICGGRCIRLSPSSDIILLTLHTVWLACSLHAYVQITLLGWL